MGSHGRQLAWELVVADFMSAEQSEAQAKACDYNQMPSSGTDSSSVTSNRGSIRRLKNNITILAFKKIKREKMAWIYLFIAGLFEIGWAVGLKYTDGFTKLWPSVITIVIMILSFYFLSSAVKTIPIGTAYAIWTGIGAVGTAILGIFLFGESKEFVRLFFILLIIIGIVGLKIFSKVPVQ